MQKDRNQKRTTGQKAQKIIAQALIISVFYSLFLTPVAHANLRLFDGRQITVTNNISTSSGTIENLTVDTLTVDGVNVGTTIADMIAGEETGVIALTPAASVSVNASQGRVFTLTPNQNFTLESPTNLTSGKEYTFIISNDATAYTMNWGSAFSFVNDMAYELSDAANAVHVFKGSSDGTNIYMTEANTAMDLFSGSMVKTDELLADEISTASGTITSLATEALTATTITAAGVVSGSQGSFGQAATTFSAQGDDTVGDFTNAGVNISYQNVNIAAGLIANYTGGETVDVAKLTDGNTTGDDGWDIERSLSSSIVFDLGSAKAIHSLKLYFGAGNASGSSTNDAQLLGSNDPSFTTSTILNANWSVGATAGATLTVPSSSTDTFRYIKMDKPAYSFGGSSSSALWINEIEVFESVNGEALGAWQNDVAVGAEITSAVTFEEAQSIGVDATKYATLVDNNSSTGIDGEYAQDPPHKIWINLGSSTRLASVNVEISGGYAYFNASGAQTLGGAETVLTAIANGANTITDPTEYAYLVLEFDQNQGISQFREFEIFESAYVSSNNTIDAILDSGAGAAASSSVVVYDENGSVISGVGKVNVATEIDGGGYSALQDMETFKTSGTINYSAELGIRVQPVGEIQISRVTLDSPASTTTVDNTGVTVASDSVDVIELNTDGSITADSIQLGSTIQIGYSDTATVGTATGSIRFNSGTNTFEGFDGVTWSQIAGVGEVESFFENNAGLLTGSGVNSLTLTGVIEALSLSGTIISTSGTISDLIATNITATNIITDELNTASGTIDSLTSTTGSITNLTTQDLSATTVTATTVESATFSGTTANLTSIVGESAILGTNSITYSVSGTGALANEDVNLTYSETLTELSTVTAVGNSDSTGIGSATAAPLINNNQVFTTTQGSEVYLDDNSGFSVDVGLTSVQGIDQVELWYYSYHTFDWDFSSVIIETANDAGFTANHVNHGVFPFTYDGTANGGSRTVTFALPAGTTGQYVRVTTPDKSGLYEINLLQRSQSYWENATSFTDITSNATIIGDSGFNATTANTIDGDTGTWASVASALGELEFDLGQVEKVAQFTFNDYYDGSDRKFTQVEIQKSGDGAVWTSHQVLDNSTEQLYANDIDFELETIQFNELETRFIKIIFTRGVSNFPLREINLFSSSFSSINNTLETTFTESGITVAPGATVVYDENNVAITGAGNINVEYTTDNGSSWSTPVDLTTFQAQTASIISPGVFNLRLQPVGDQRISGVDVGTSSTKATANQTGLAVENNSVEVIKLNTDGSIEADSISLSNTLEAATLSGNLTAGSVTANAVEATTVEAETLSGNVVAGDLTADEINVVSGSITNLATEVLTATEALFGTADQVTINSGGITYTVDGTDLFTLNQSGSVIAQNVIITTESSLTNLDTNYPAASHTGSWAVIDTGDATPDDGLYLSAAGLWVQKVNDGDFAMGSRADLYDYDPSAIGYSSTDELSNAVNTNPIIGTHSFSSESNTFDGNDSSAPTLSWAAGQHVGKETDGHIHIGKFRIYIGTYNYKTELKIQGLTVDNDPSEVNWVDITPSGIVEGFQAENRWTLNGAVIDNDTATRQADGNGYRTQEIDVIVADTTKYHGFRLLLNATYNNSSNYLYSFEGFQESGVTNPEVNLVGSINKLHTGEDAQEIALSAAASVLVDASAGEVFALTPEQNFTLENPTNLLAGKQYTFAITNPETAYDITWGSAYKFADGVNPQLSHASGTVDYFQGTSDGTSIYMTASSIAVRTFSGSTVVVGEISATTGSITNLTTQDLTATTVESATFSGVTANLTNVVGESAIFGTESIIYSLSGTGSFANAGASLDEDGSSYGNTLNYGPSLSDGSSITFIAGAGASSNHDNIADGDDGTSSQSGNAVKPDFYLDMGSSKTVNNVLIYQNSSYNYRVNEIQVSNNASSWTTVWTGDQIVDDNYISIDITEATAQYVRFISVNSGTWRINEISLRLGSPVTTSNTIDTTFTESGVTIAPGATVIYDENNVAITGAGNVNVEYTTDNGSSWSSPVDLTAFQAQTTSIISPGVFNLRLQPVGAQRISGVDIGTPSTKATANSTGLVVENNSVEVIKLATDGSITADSINLSNTLEAATLSGNLTANEINAASGTIDTLTATTGSFTDLTTDSLQAALVAATTFSGTTGNITNINGESGGFGTSAVTYSGAGTGSFTNVGANLSEDGVSFGNTSSTVEKIISSASVGSSYAGGGAQLIDGTSSQWVAGNTTSETATLDLGSPQTFDVVSILIGLFNGHDVDTINNIEGSNDNVTFSSIYTDTFNFAADYLNYQDIAVPSSTYRYIKITFNEASSYPTVKEVKVYKSIINTTANTIDTTFTESGVTIAPGATVVYDENDLAITGAGNVNVQYTTDNGSTWSAPVDLAVFQAQTTSIISPGIFNLRLQPVGDQRISGVDIGTPSTKATANSTGLAVENNSVEVIKLNTDGSITADSITATTLSGATGNINTVNADQVSLSSSTTVFTASGQADFSNEGVNVEYLNNNWTNKSEPDTGTNYATVAQSPSIVYGTDQGFGTTFTEAEMRAASITGTRSDWYIDLGVGNDQELGNIVFDTTDDERFQAYSIAASNDNSTYTVIENDIPYVSDPDGSSQRKTVSYSFDPIGSYRYWRFFGTWGSGGGPKWGDFNFYNVAPVSVGNTVDTTLSISGSPTIAPSSIVIKDYTGTVLNDNQINIAYNLDGAGMTSLESLAAFKARPAFSNVSSLVLQLQPIGEVAFNSVEIFTPSTAVDILETGSITIENSGADVITLDATGKIIATTGSFTDLTTNSLQAALVVANTFSGTTGNITNTVGETAEFGIASATYSQSGTGSFSNTGANLNEDGVSFGNNTALIDNFSLSGTISKFGSFNDANGTIDNLIDGVTSTTYRAQVETPAYEIDFGQTRTYNTIRFYWKLYTYDNHPLSMRISNYNGSWSEITTFNWADNDWIDDAYLTETFASQTGSKIRIEVLDGESQYYSRLNEIEIYQESYESVNNTIDTTFTQSGITIAPGATAVYDENDTAITGAGNVNVQYTTDNGSTWSAPVDLAVFQAQTTSIASPGVFNLRLQPVGDQRISGVDIGTPSTKATANSTGLAVENNSVEVIKLNTDGSIQADSISLSNTLAAATLSGNLTAGSVNANIVEAETLSGNIVAGDVIADEINTASGAITNLSTDALTATTVTANTFSGATANLTSIVGSLAEFASPSATYSQSGTGSFVNVGANLESDATSLGNVQTVLGPNLATSATIETTTGMSPELMIDGDTGTEYRPVTSGSSIVTEVIDLEGVYDVAYATITFRTINSGYGAIIQKIEVSPDNASYTTAWSGSELTTSTSSVVRNFSLNNTSGQRYVRITVSAGHPTNSQMRIAEVALHEYDFATTQNTLDTAFITPGLTVAPAATVVYDENSVAITGANKVNVQYTTDNGSTWSTAEDLADFLARTQSIVSPGIFNLRLQPIDGQRISGVDIGTPSTEANISSTGLAVENNSVEVIKLNTDGSITADTLTATTGSFTDLTTNSLQAALVAANTFSGTTANLTSVTGESAEFGAPATTYEFNYSDFTNVLAGLEGDAVSWSNVRADITDIGGAARIVTNTLGAADDAALVDNDELTRGGYWRWNSGTNTVVIDMQDDQVNPAKRFKFKRWKDPAWVAGGTFSYWVYGANQLDLSDKVQLGTNIVSADPQNIIIEEDVAFESNTQVYQYIALQGSTTTANGGHFNQVALRELEVQTTALVDSNNTMDVSVGEIGVTIAPGATVVYDENDLAITGAGNVNVQYTTDNGSSWSTPVDLTAFQAQTTSIISTGVFNLRLQPVGDQRISGVDIGTPSTKATANSTGLAVENNSVEVIKLATDGSITADSITLSSGLEAQVLSGVITSASGTIDDLTATSANITDVVGETAAFGALSAVFEEASPADFINLGANVVNYGAGLGNELDGSYATTDNTFETSFGTTGVTVSPSTLVVYDESDLAITGAGKVNVEYTTDNGSTWYPQVPVNEFNSGNKQTSASSPYTVDASGDIGAGFEGYKAFNGLVGPTVTNTWVVADTQDEWVSIDLGSGNEKAFGAVSIASSYNTGYSPKDFRIQGSNNNTNWDDLLVVTGRTDWVADQYYTQDLFQDSGSYRYYRVYVDANNGNPTWIGIGDVRFYEYSKDLTEFQNISPIVSAGVFNLRLQPIDGQQISSVEISAPATKTIANNTGLSIENNSSEVIKLATDGSITADSISLSSTIEAETLSGAKVVIDGIQVLSGQLSAITDVSGTASGTDSTLINDLKTAVNGILSRLRTHGLISN